MRAPASRPAVPVATAALLVSLLAPTAGRTQQPGPAPEGRFAERIEVRVINLEAVVVDRQGRRVRGLGPEDFALEVDGKSVPVEYFSEIADGLAMPVAEAAAPLPTAAPVAARPGQRVATSYLVFIDSYFTRVAARRNQVLEDIEKNLARLGPEDRMAIVAFDGRRLNVISSWTGSSEELAAALAEARALPARGFMTSDLAREIERDIEIEEDIARTIAEANADLGDEASAAGASIRADGLPTNVCWTIERLERRIERAVVGVTASLRSFAKPPGRKVMMLLSGGWPQSAKEYLVGGRPMAALDCPQRGPSIYRPIHETANRIGYTLYPVDVPPPDAGVVTAEADGAQLFRDGGASSGPVGGDTQFTRTFEVHSTLLKLAEETGGEALIDGAAETAFEALVDDTRTYYWLGFTPQWKGDDRRHEVKLKVLTPGLEVRTRGGYIDLSRQAEISYVTESALLFGDLPGAQALGMELGELPAKGRGRVSVPLRLTIPMDAITMTPEQGGYVARLELRVAVVDEQGHRNEIAVMPVTLGGPEPPPAGSHAIYETEIKLRRRPHDVVVSLYDPMGDTILAASGHVGSDEGPSG